MYNTELVIKVTGFKFGKDFNGSRAQLIMRKKVSNAKEAENPGKPTAVLLF